MIAILTKTAREEILSTYDGEQLQDIAAYGCSSGCASSHICYSETEDFFNKHEDEIENHFLDLMGDNYLAEFAANVASMQGLKNVLVWAFIESIAEETASA